VHSATAQNEGMRFGAEPSSPVSTFCVICEVCDVQIHLTYALLGLLTNGLSRTQKRQGFLIQLSA
jgi:hypothetical protein